MHEIRYNPFTDEWVIFSSARQKRPDRDSQCPFCPGGEEHLDFSHPKALPNRYPSLNSDIVLKKYRTGEFFKKMTGYGDCKIVVYTDDHNAEFVELPQEKIIEIFDLWIKETNNMITNKDIKYILPFENYGPDVGATLEHPHGQIYAFPFIPNNILREFNTMIDYYSNNKNCMRCDYINAEIRAKDRVVYQDSHVVALVPFFNEYAYDVYIFPNRHINFLRQATRRELESFAYVLPKIILAIRAIFQKDVSYSLSLHQAPLNTPKSSIFHLYFKIHTPQRNVKSLKLLGAVETAGKTFINGTLPEEAAQQIRQKLI